MFPSKEYSSSSQNRQKTEQMYKVYNEVEEFAETEKNLVQF